MKDPVAPEPGGRDGSGTAVRPPLNPTQVAAGALAAISSAVAASYLGVSGTISGAAVSSVVTSTAATVYGHYLDRTRSRLRQVLVTQVVGPPGTGPGGAPVPDGVAERNRAAHALAAQAGVDTAPTSGSNTGPDTGAGTDPGTGAAAAGADAGAGAGGRVPPALRRWLPAAGMAAVIFLIAMGAITAFEAATGQPLPATVRGTHGSGTTIGRTFGSGGGKAPQPTATPGTPQTTPTANPVPPAGSAPPTSTTTPPPTSGPAAPPSGAPSGPPSAGSGSPRLGTGAGDPSGGTG